MSKNDDNKRILPPPDDSDEAMVEYGRQLAMDSLLSDLAERGQTAPQKTSVAGPRKQRSKKVIPIIIAAAACLLIGLAVWFVLKGREPVRPIPGNPGGDPHGTIALGPGWVGESQDAEYEVLSSGVVVLKRGEIHIKSVPTETVDTARVPLEIRTPNAKATATGTEFYVGTHEYTGESEQDMKALTRLTRVLVLSGAVTLTTASGSVAGEANDLLAAKKGDAPVKETVQANSDFAIDLYKQLAEGDMGKNIFFSPYSIMNALSMTAEGARGKTADEMGKVLRYPKTARRVGNDAQLIPWRTALIHSGFKTINAMLNPKADSKETAAIRKQIKKLRAELDSVKKATDKAMKDRKWDAYRKLSQKQKPIADKLNGLLSQVDQFKLNVANAIWAEKTYRVEKPFKDTIEKHYRTGAFLPADFKTNFEGERVRINAWVEKQTEDKIKDLIAQGNLNEFTRMVLVNAIYFKGEWSTPFKERDTKRLDFTMQDGNKVKTPTMSGSLSDGTYGAFNADGSFFKTPTMTSRGFAPRSNAKKPKYYPDKGGFAMATLPYKGDELSMVLIAPVAHDGLPAIEQKLTSAKLNEWIKATKKRKMNVKLPKFKMETDYNLHETLPKMGMVCAFTDPRHKNGADFTGMHMTENRMDRLYITKVLHKAFVEVNEKGTEAAAATAVIMAVPTSAPMSRPFTPVFSADRPFLMLIRHNKTGTILFMGRVSNPAK